MHQIRCFHFAPISFFPKFGYEDILNIEFDLTYYLNGYQVNDDMNFREVCWFHDRLQKQLEEEKHNGSRQAF